MERRDPSPALKDPFCMSYDSGIFVAIFLTKSGDGIFQKMNPTNYPREGSGIFSRYNGLFIPLYWGISGVFFSYRSRFIAWILDGIWIPHEKL